MKLATVFSRDRSHQKLENLSYPRWTHLVYYSYFMLDYANCNP